MSGRELYIQGSLLGLDVGETGPDGVDSLLEGGEAVAQKQPLRLAECPVDRAPEYVCVCV